MIGKNRMSLAISGVLLLTSGLSFNTSANPYESYVKKEEQIKVAIAHVNAPASNKVIAPTAVTRPTTTTTAPVTEVETIPVIETEVIQETNTEPEPAIEIASVAYPGRTTPISYTDRDLLALYNVVEHEVGGCSVESKHIVASVVLNRVVKSGDSIYNVIAAPNQFSGIHNYIGRTEYASNATKEAVNTVLNDSIDYSYGALYFYAPKYCGNNEWFESMNLVMELDGHRYFKP